MVPRNTVPPALACLHGDAHTYCLAHRDEFIFVNTDFCSWQRVVIQEKGLTQGGAILFILSKE